MPKVKLLTELASPLARIERRIDAVEVQITLHVLKLFYFSDGSRKHWVDELYGLLSNFSYIRWKKTNRYPPQKFYQSILFDTHIGNDGMVDQDTVMSLIKGELSGRYKTLTPKDKLNFKNLAKFYDQLTMRLSRGECSIENLRKIAKLLDV